MSTNSQAQLFKDPYKRNFLRVNYFLQEKNNNYKF